ncbi:hypothetical protein [Thermosulfurimonas dismutans]|uniref:hypothetical protein n=1 Tax=Thermosulfurimonas dismutans TaxID=999894 RepID=UPI0012948533|nr:hypothetical protein [Thermosulfurimonas dismutans]
MTVWFPSGFLAQAFALSCGLSPARAFRAPSGGFAVVVPASALSSVRPRCAFCARLGRCAVASPGPGCGFRPFRRPPRQGSLFKLGA